MVRVQLWVKSFTPLNTEYQSAAEQGASKTLKYDAILTPSGQCRELQFSHVFYIQTDRKHEALVT